MYRRMASTMILLALFLSDLWHTGLAAPKMGVTAVKSAHYPEFGIDNFSCHNGFDPNGMNCNPYQGDTSCDTELPVLCVKIDHSARPPYFVVGAGGALETANYFGWNGGHITTTVPVKASRFETRLHVSTFCAEAFGTGWEVAQLWWGQCYYISNMNGTKYSGVEWTANKAKFQTSGWGCFSYGNIRNDTRLWINGPWDQQSTCWKQ